MTLRRRILVRALAVLLPMATLLALASAEWSWARARARTAAVLRAHVTDAERARCEADPAAYRRSLGGDVEVRAHDAGGAPHGGGHPLSASVREELARGADVAGALFWRADPFRGEVAVPTRWSDSACAVFVARWRSGIGRGRAGYLTRATAGALAALLVALLFVGLAVGPSVRRVVALRDRVRRATEDGGGADPVERAGDEAELRELARALDDARRTIGGQLEELAAREAALRRYVDDTTHDLAIPLTTLAGELDALDEAARAGEPLERPRVASAIAEVHHLAQRLGDLAVRARSEGRVGDPVRDTVDLRDLVERVTERMRSLARAREMDLDHAVPDAPVLVRVDALATMQAIANLVENALVYGRPGGYVAVVLDADAERFTLRVEDDGPGVAEQDLSRLALEGYRATGARERRPEGRGLGLAIVARIARDHGMTLRFEPSDAGGLTASLEGPLEPP